MNKTKNIEQLIDVSEKITETLGSRYLTSRGLVIDGPIDDLLYSPKTFNKELGVEVPAIIAIARHTRTKEVMGVQRIYLGADAGKAKVKNPKMFLGSKLGSAVFFDTPKSEINVAEGIETALAVRIATNAATASVIDSGNMKSFLPPESVKVVRIWADKDENLVGIKSAQFLASSLVGLGYEVYIHEPLSETESCKSGLDWLDVLNKSGKSKLLESLETTRPFALKADEASTNESGSSVSLMGHDDQGIFLKTDLQKIYVTSPIRLLYECRDENGEKWSKVLEVTDPDGKKHEIKIPYEDFACSPNEVLKPLSDRGFRVYSSRSNDIIAHLNKIKIDHRKTLVSQTGWQIETFLTPSYAIGKNAGAFKFYSTDLTVKLSQSGTMDEWKDKVAIYARGNPVLLAALSMSFVAPLLKFQKLQNFGVHLHGPSSCGKSTAAKVAASVWSKPFGVDSFVQTWRATGNALEGMANAHNDLILILDEISEANPDEIKNICYMLGNGQGKSRANQIGQAQAKKYFTLVYLSNGEETLESIADKNQNIIKAGQEVRFIEIDADAGCGYGILKNLHGHDASKDLILNLEKSIRLNYGHAGKLYLEKLCVESENRDGLAKKIDSKRNLFLEQLNEKSNQQVIRVADSFSLIAAAGELAVDFGVLPFAAGEVSSAVYEVFNVWKNAKNRTKLSDDQRALEQVKHFFETDGESRFSNEDDGGDRNSHERSLKRAGFKVVHNGVDCWFVLPQVFKKEVCRGFVLKQVVNTLNESGFLVRDDQGKKGHVSKTIKGQTFRGYCISTEILDL